MGSQSKLFHISLTMKIYLATALLLFVLHAAITAEVETPENDLDFDVMAEDTFAEEEEDVADSDTEDEEAAERRFRGNICLRQCRCLKCRCYFKCRRSRG